MKFKILIIILILAQISLKGFSQVIVPGDSLYEEKMQWFEDAKLGIFIHWGIYAVEGIAESWSFYNGYISHEDYLKQCNSFSASKYEPSYWVDLIKKSGAKYSVITTRHHDGFSLWDSKYGELNSVEHSIARKDVLSPFIKELKKSGLKTGLYYSLPDWSHKDYTHHTRKSIRYKIEDERKRWKKYQKYYFGQLNELKKNYEPDLWWFDGDWEHSAKEWDVEKIKNKLSKGSSEVIFNSRLNDNGDYKTPEIGMPVTRLKDRYWELCMTMNDSWGFQKNDNNYKSSQQIIDIFVDCISKGGNLLLDIGPKADGSIPKEQVEILEDLGRWTNKHKEAIFGSRKGIAYDHFYGPTTLSKDSTTLYLYVRDIPKDGKVAVKGLKNKINRIFVVGEGSLLQHKTFCTVYWSEYPGISYIDIPEDVQDKNYTVLALMLDGKLKLYREQ